MSKDTKQEKKVKEDWIKNQIEYKNPNLPWNNPKRVNFPDLTEKEREFILSCDIYGNPVKETPEKTKEELEQEEWDNIFKKK